MPRSYGASQIIGWRDTGRPAAGAPLPTLFAADQLDAWARTISAQVEDMAEEAAVGMLKEQTTLARDEVIAKESARSGGIAPLYRQYVDGNEAPLSAIQPDSTIVLVWNYLPEVSIKTYEALLQRSPMLTGRYKEGLLVFLDDVPAELSQITVSTKEVRIVATVPYARRLEVGKTKTGRSFVRQVAPHIVEETSIIARRKFGDLASLTYTYLDLADPYALSAAGMIPRHFENGRWRKASTPRTRRGMLETHVRYPSILITPRE